MSRNRIIPLREKYGIGDPIEFVGDLRGTKTRRQPKGLKACPFCGRNDQLTMNRRVDMWHAQFEYRITCGGCVWTTTHWGSYNCIINHWNKRCAPMIRGEKMSGTEVEQLKADDWVWEISQPDSVLKNDAPRRLKRDPNPFLKACYKTRETVCYHVIFPEGQTQD